jgi:copper chaperone CopZ
MPATTRLLAALALGVLLLAAPPARAEETRPAAPPEAPRTETVWLEVAAAGPESEKAVTAAEGALRAVPGVSSLDWSAPGKEVRIVRVEGKASDADLAKAAGAVGASVTRVPVARLELSFEKALHCNGCKAKVERALRKLEGTKEVAVRADKGGVAVTYDTRTGKPEAVRKALQDVGYPARP